MLLSLSAEITKQARYKSVKNRLKRIFLYIALIAVSACLLHYAVKTTEKSASEKEKSDFGEILLPSGGKSNELTESTESTESGKETESQPVPAAPEKTLSASEYLAQNPFYAESEEYALSDGVYDDTYRLTLVTPSDSTFFDKAKYTARYEDENGVVSSADYFTMWPRMGFIIAADENGRRALNAKGETIVFPEETSMVFFGVRDAQNRPIFKDWRSDTLYAVEQDGTITETSYDERVDSRGVFFDYPSYYGVSDDPDCTVVSSRSAFGYRVHENKSVPTSYTKAYAFSEGYGCATDDQNRLYFYNADGRLRIGGLASVMYGVADGSREDALGYFYFDEGLTRVIRRQYSRGELISEHETFVNRKGTEFRVPSDYTVAAYHCGRILVQKGEFSGYMTSRGKFICDPIYTYARPFFEGLAVVGEKDGKKGMMDRDGNMVIPMIFDEITDCSGGVICLYDETCGWQILNKTAPVPSEAQPDRNESTDTE